MLHLLFNGLIVGEWTTVRLLNQKSQNIPIGLTEFFPQKLVATIQQILNIFPLHIAVQNHRTTMINIVVTVEITIVASTQSEHI
jgi:hypothetical protein